MKWLADRILGLSLGVVGALLVMLGSLAASVLATRLLERLKIDDHNHMDTVPPGWYLLPWLALGTGIAVAHAGSRVRTASALSLWVKRAGVGLLVLAFIVVVVVVPIQANMWNADYQARGMVVDDGPMDPADSWF